MKDQIVSFEVALLARDKGFINGSSYYYDIQTHFLYVWNDMIGSIGLENGDSPYHIEAPNASLLQKWLRNNNSIYVSIKYKPDEIINKFELSIYQEIYHRYTEIYATYEEALEEGLKNGLTLIEI